MISISTARWLPLSAPASSRQFPKTTRNIFALLAFAAGFLVRPFGALVFGRLGDLVGRKYTFLITILIMGLVDLHVSVCCPATRPIGMAAPITLIALAHAAGPGARRRIRRRGDLCGRARAAMAARLLHQSWIQTTATSGLFAVAAGHPVHR
jgi:MFS family permease